MKVVLYEKETNIGVLPKTSTQHNIRVGRNSWEEVKIEVMDVRASKEISKQKRMYGLLIKRDLD